MRQRPASAEPGRTTTPTSAGHCDRRPTANQVGQTRGLAADRRAPASSCSHWRSVAATTRRSHSSSCDAAAAAAAAAAAGLTPPDVVVAPVVVVVAGGGVTATTVVVWDSVTVAVDRVGAVTVGVDRVGAVTEGVDRVGVVRVPPLVSVPPAESFPPPHAARKPTANNAIIAAAPPRSNEKARLVTTHERSHSRATDPSPNRDEPRSCTGA